MFAFAVYKLIIFGLFLVGAMLLSRLADRIGLGAGTLLTAALQILLSLLVRAEPGASAVLNAALYGTLAAGLGIWAGRWLQARRERRAVVQAQDDDPTPIPPSGDEPVAEGGAA